MRKIDRFYEKFNGSYFAFLGAGTSIASIFIALILYLAVDPTFTITKNYISDLGDGYNYSNVIFNIGHIFSGIFMALFFLYFARLLHNMGISNLTYMLLLISGMIYSIGTILVGIFPSKSAYEMHLIGAVLIFFGMFFIYISFSVSEYKISEFHKFFIYIGILLAPFPIMFMLFQVLSFLVGFDSRITIFTEWITYFAMMCWIIIQGFCKVRTK